MKINFVIILSLVCFSCAQEVGEQSFWTVEDVTKSEQRISLLLEETPEILNVHVNGTADGSFQIVANGQQDNKIFEFRGGDIDTIISDYWKSPTCKTIYVPKGVKNGNLQISTLLYPKK